MGAIKSLHRSTNPEEQTITHIYQKKLLSSKLIWSMPEYLGQQQVKISHDGQELIAFGSTYFGKTIRTLDVEPILFIYSNSKTTQTKTYQDITKSSLGKDIKKYELKVMGGDWTDISEILTLNSVDWKNRTIDFKYKGQTELIKFNF